MADFPALPFYTDAYLADTRHLTAAQHGAYFLLLMTAWRMSDNALPDDDAKLSSWASMDKRTWLKNKSVVMSFWQRTDGKWRQKKLDMVRKNVAHLSNKNAENAKVRWLKNKETGYAMAMPDVCQTDAIQNQNQISSSSRDKLTLPRAREPDASPVEQPQDETGRKPWLEIIEAFDAARTEFWGESQSRLAPAATDAITAQGWNEIGITASFCRTHFREEMAKMATQNRAPPRVLKFFDASLRDSVSRCSTSVKVSESTWKNRLFKWIEEGFWKSEYGPEPHENGAFVPKELLEKYGIKKHGMGAAA